MTPSSRVFRKYRPRPGQLRQVATWRLGDARALLATRDRERANGAIYLAGFAVECWLKARLLERHPRLAPGLPARDLSPAERRAESLLWSHDVPGMLDVLPEIALTIRRDLEPVRAAATVRTLTKAAEWTIYIRYASVQEDTRVAEDFVLGVEELKRWLT